MSNEENPKATRWVDPRSDAEIIAQRDAAWAAKHDRARAEHRAQIQAIAEKTGSPWTEEDINADWQQIMAHRPAPEPITERAAPKAKPRRKHITPEAIAAEPTLSNGHGRHH